MASDADLRGAFSSDVARSAKLQSADVGKAEVAETLLVIRTLGAGNHPSHALITGERMSAELRGTAAEGLEGCRAEVFVAASRAAGVGETGAV